MTESANHKPREHPADGSTNGSDPDHDYQKYIDERNWLTRSSFEQQRDLDKWLMTLAGGALVLSWTAVSWLLTESKLEYTCILVLGWLALAFSLISTILSMRFSVDAYDAYRQKLDTAFGRRDELGNIVWEKIINDQESLPHNSRVEFWNNAALYSLIAGLLFVTLFVGINIPGDSTDVGEERSATIE